MPERSGWEGSVDAPRFTPNLGYRPTVSVVILSHRPEMLPLALRSVHDQTFPQDQIEIIVKHGAVYHGHKLNQALNATAGRYIVPLCDDDVLAPTFLEKTVALAESSGADFVYTDIFLFGGPDGDRPLLPLPPFNAYTVTQRAVPWMTALFRRETFARLTPTPPWAWLRNWMGIPTPLAPYDPHMQYLDIDLNRSMARLGMVGLKVAEPLFHAREHPDNGHKHMDHGWAHTLVRTKHLLIDPPVPPLPEFVYPAWYEGRPDILTGV